MAPSGQLRQPQLLVKELSHCGSLQGCPKIFLLLSSGLKGEWMDSDPSFGGMNRKAGSCCPTYTAMGWGASPPAAWEPEAFLLHLGKICSQHPHWSLLQLLTEVGHPEEGKAGPMSPWPPTVSYDQTNSGSVAPVLQTGCRTCLRNYMGSPRLQMFFPPHNFAQSIPSVSHALPAGLAPGIYTEKHPASPVNTDTGNDYCSVLLKGPGS